MTQAALEPFLDAETVGEIAGRFDVAATVEASSLDVRDITGEVVFDRAELQLARVPLAQIQPTRLRLADGRVDVVSWSWAGAGNRLDLTGHAIVTGVTPSWTWR